MAPSPRDLPQIEALLGLPALGRLAERYSPAETAEALRAQIALLREALLAGDASPLPDFGGDPFAAQVETRIEAGRLPSLRAAINATGILIHTNLGRAALAPQAVAAMHMAATEASTLEFDLATGKRGSRHGHVSGLITELTGAQDAIVVNNCAAAVLLALTATAAGREVIASRGELIEIGGSYRLPDVIAQSGARLREVGTTNKTRTGDYAQAIGDDTAVLLKSHTSNFRITGFTAAPDRRDLARLSRDSGLVLMEDLGSGVLVDLAPFGLSEEPVVRDVLAAGVDLVMFSGDKLLGGPQAGIIAGRRDLIALLRAHPLMRALRADKLTLAALEATLRLYRAPHDPMADVPVLALLAQPLAVVEGRAQAMVQALLARGVAAAEVEVVESTAQIGAGALPLEDLRSWAVALRLDGLDAEACAHALRCVATPVIGRIHRGRVWLDMRTVRDDQMAALAEACAQVSGR